LPAEGDYYDLQKIPERYTGYTGKDARRVWRSIYEENCFGVSELNLMSGKSAAPVSLPDTMIEALHADRPEPDTHCLEKRVYYKVISGMFTPPSLFITKLIQYPRTPHIHLNPHLP
jgi:ERO1-like protein beta